MKKVKKKSQTAKSKTKTTSKKPTVKNPSKPKSKTKSTSKKNITKSSIKPKTKPKSGSKKAVAKSSIKPKTKPKSGSKKAVAKSSIKPKSKPKSGSKKVVAKQVSKSVSKIKLSKTDKKLLKLKQYFKVDLRKYKNSPETKKFILSLRAGYESNHFQQRFTQYLLQSVIMYYDLYNISARKLYNEHGISNYILNKILNGNAISNKSYKKFMAATELILTSTEKSFLWGIINHLKRYGRISKERIKNIINELIEFKNNNDNEDIDFSLYDLLRLSYA